MTRREFTGAVAGAAILPGCAPAGASTVVVLQAIAGARLPATLAIRTNTPEQFRPGVWELRTYESAAPNLESSLAEVFQRAGIRPVSREAGARKLSYLIPFEDLAARDRAWTVVNADPRWATARSQFQSYHFGLYRVA